jgi:hypothetical protein
LDAIAPHGFDADTARFQRPGGEEASRTARRSTGRRSDVIDRERRAAGPRDRPALHQILDRADGGDVALFRARVLGWTSLTT